VLDLGFQTALSSEFLDKMRIREKSNIKNDIGIVGNAILIPEGGQEHAHTAGTSDLAKNLLHLSLSLVNVQIARIDHLIRQFPHPFQGFTFPCNPFLNRSFARTRVGASSLVKSAQQHFIRRIEKKHLDMMSGGAHLS